MLLAEIELDLAAWRLSMRNEVRISTMFSIKFPISRNSHIPEVEILTNNC